MTKKPELILPKPCRECKREGTYKCFECKHKSLKDKAEKRYQDQYYRNHPSKYGIDYTKRIKAGSGDTIGVYENDILTATIKRGYYGGGIPHTQWKDPYYQSILINIDFKDGCSTGMSFEKLEPGWQNKVETMLKELEDKMPELQEEYTARQLTFEKLTPLQDKASEHATNMFDIIDQIKTKHRKF